MRHWNVYSGFIAILVGAGDDSLPVSGFVTDKECKIFELNNNFGELIPRETLRQKIWINEGVITGRSLDMLVSKLQMKLSLDPELRIKYSWKGV